jgi:transglutaminase-like putative cysteine protease
LLNVILRRVRSFVALDSSERRLALRATAWLAVARVALLVAPFAAIRRRIDGIRPRGSPVTPSAVRRAVQRAARSLPGSSCLAQSVVAEALLRASGQPALLTIGVSGARTSAAAPLDAHAWVVSGDLLVAGDARLEDYYELMTFGTRS